MKFREYVRALSKVGFKDIKLMAYTDRNYIFSAKHERYGDVAIKTPKLGSGRVLGINVDPEDYLKEFKLSKLLNDEHIVKVYDVLRVKDGLPILIEEKGHTSLRELLKVKGKLGICQAIKISVALLKAIEIIHECGFVYGDLKPENVVITSSGNAKIVDLETIRPIEDPIARATLDYSAPEQLLECRTLPESDVYQVALILHEMVTGYARNPIFGEELVIDEPKWLKNLLLKALNKDYKSRLKLEEFLSELMKYLNNFCKGND